MLREKKPQNKGCFVRIIFMFLCVCVFLSETEEREKKVWEMSVRKIIFWHTQPKKIAPEVMAKRNQDGHLTVLGDF